MINLNCLKGEKHELGILVQKMINCRNEENYNTYHNGDKQSLGQASLTLAKRNNKKSKLKSVIQKYNKASMVCRDNATFLPT